MLRKNNLNHQLRSGPVKFRTNDYIDFALLQFKRNTLEQIAADCLSMNIDNPSEVNKALDADLEQINFMKTYLDKTTFRKEKNLVIDYDSFKKFIYTKIPSLENPKDYIADKLGLTQTKEGWIKKINAIKKTINEYNNGNKQSFITAFNQDMDRILTSLQDKNNLSCLSNIENQVKAGLNTMQAKENQYYLPLFFVESRKANSTLQKKINEANQILISKPADDKSAHIVPSRRHYS